jgi:hypothetical protein
MTDQSQYPIPITLPPNVGKPGGPRFLDVLNYHIGIKLQKFVGGKLNKETMELMYDCVAETVHGVFSKGSQNIHEDARCWLAQKMYETIKVGDSPIITRDEDTWKHNVHPVYQKCTLERVPLQDLRLIAGLFSEATFASQILDELKRRGAR